MKIQTRFIDQQGKPIDDRIPAVIPSMCALSAGATLTAGDLEYDVVSSSFTLDQDVLSNDVVLRKVKHSFVADLSEDGKQWVGLVTFLGSALLIFSGYAFYLRSPEQFSGAVGFLLRWGIPLSIVFAGFVISHLINKAYLNKRPTFWGLYLYFMFSWGGLWIAFFWGIYFAPPFDLSSFPADYARYAEHFRSVFDPVQPLLATALGWLSLAIGLMGMEGVGKIIGAFRGK